MSCVPSRIIRASALAVSLWLAQGAWAGQCKVLETALEAASGRDAVSGIANHSVAEALRKLPPDERAWARQAQATWEALVEGGSADAESLARFEHELAVVGKARIDAAVGAVARDDNVVVIAFPEEPTAYQLLAMSWQPTTPKSIHVKGKTASQGIAQGFVPVDQSLSKAAISPESVTRYQQLVDQCLQNHEATAIALRRANQTAVIRAGKPIWVRELMPGDQVVQILADSWGRPFVSDLDLLAIATRAPEPAPLARARQLVRAYGDITEPEHRIVREINRKFQELDGVDPKNHEHRRSLVQHGAANRFEGSPPLSSANFPMTVYRPDGAIDQARSEAELRALLAQLRSEGYVVPDNPGWGWSGEK